MGPIICSVFMVFICCSGKEPVGIEDTTIDTINTKIAYMSRVDTINNTWDVHVINVDGSNVMKIDGSKQTNVTNSYNTTDYWPTWSPIIE